jgi:NADPH:quinone reductase-like Zn-dependent oxidoreductase
VTAVCSTANVNLIKSLGADNVVDYTREDFTKQETRYDIIFDAVGKTSKSACKHILKPKGRYISILGTPDKNPNDLLFLKDLIEAGKLKAVIDRRYTLEQIRNKEDDLEL